MKKKLNSLIAVLLIITISSCSSSKKIPATTSALTGSWQLSSITTEGVNNRIKTEILDEADFNCFIGSLWHFNRRDNKGYYRISKNGTECAAVRRNINWSLQDEAGIPKMLRYTRADANYKNFSDSTAGHQFTLLSLDKTSMQLKNEVSVAGKPAVLTYNFIRN